MSTILKAATITILALLISSGTALAKEKNEGIFEKIKNRVVGVFVGDEKDDERMVLSADVGNANALEQIDRNIEKHGGNHKGLENARAAVSKEKQKNKMNDVVDADDENNGIIDDVADAVERAVEDTAEAVDTTTEALTGTNASDDSVNKTPRRKKPKMGNGKSKGNEFNN